MSEKAVAICMVILFFIALAIFVFGLWVEGKLP